MSAEIPARREGRPWWAARNGAGRLSLWVHAPARCCDCQADIHGTYEYFMVRNQVWHEAGMCRWGHLCVGCLEARIGRRLVRADFNDVPLSEVEGPFPHSARLTARLRDAAPEGIPIPRDPERSVRGDACRGVRA